MQQIIVEVTDAQMARVLMACGVYENLGRDALPAEVAAFLYNRLKEITLSVEQNIAADAAHGAPWDA